MMDVVLPAPFKRLGAQIKVSVKAGDFQPVTPTSLVVNSFEMGGLRASLPYTLGSTAWGTVANETFATTPVSYTHLDVYKRQGQRDR